MMMMMMMMMGARHPRCRKQFSVQMIKAHEAVGDTCQRFWWVPVCDEKTWKKSVMWHNTWKKGVLDRIVRVRATEAWLRHGGRNLQEARQKEQERTVTESWICSRHRKRSSPSDGSLIFQAKWGKKKNIQNKLLELNNPCKKMSDPKSFQAFHVTRCAFIPSWRIHGKGTWFFTTALDFFLGTYFLTAC